MTQTWNPAHSAATATLSNGNLTATQNTPTSYSPCFGTEGFNTGRFYWEVTVAFSSLPDFSVGIGNTSNPTTATTGGDRITSIAWYGQTQLWNNNAAQAVWSSYASGNTIAFAMDLISNLIWGRVAPAGNWNGAAIGSQNPAVGSQVGGFAIPALLLAAPVVPACYPFTNTTPDSATAAFASGSWIGAAPTGFSAFDTTSALPHTLSLTGAGLGMIAAGKMAKLLVDNPSLTRRTFISVRE